MDVGMCTIYCIQYLRMEPEPEFVNNSPYAGGIDSLKSILGLLKKYRHCFLCLTKLSSIYFVLWEDSWACADIDMIVFILYFRRKTIISWRKLCSGYQFWKRTKESPNLSTFKEPQESIPLAYVAWGSGPVRQMGLSYRLADYRGWRIRFLGIDSWAP